jgi:hypothetical protein
MVADSHQRDDTGWVVLADPEGEAVSGVTATIAAGDCHRLGLAFEVAV